MTTTAPTTRKEAWLAIWDGKGRAAPPLPADAAARTEQLLRLGGYDSATASLDPARFREEIAHLVRQARVSPGGSVFEVGCGAGAVLATLATDGHRVGGLDYAPALVAIARQAVPGADLHCAEAVELPVEPRYDAIVSKGAFLYFPDADYARRALGRMAAKARHAVYVMDVNDAQREAEGRALRESLLGPARNGLDQLFLPRSLFEEEGARHGYEVRFDAASAGHTANGRYRYNALLVRA